MSKKLFSGDWSSVDCTCEILDKKRSTFEYILTMFNRTNQMFEYSNLPDTIPADRLELFLQMNGHICFTEVNGELYALAGSPGGAPDPYYRPTFYVVANPGLNISATLRIVNYFPPHGNQDYQGKCVMMKNDTEARGMLYLYSRYATQMTENDISIRSAQINSRQQTLISATTDKDVAAANLYLKSLEEGKIIAVLNQNFLTQAGLDAKNVSMQASNNIIQLIELQQYLKASWYNEIGLNETFNMKREYMSEEEIHASTDILLPLVDDMFINRKIALDVVNSTYGTNITVKKNSAWANKQKELDTAQDIEESKVLENGGKSDGTGDS